MYRRWKINALMDMEHFEEALDEINKLPPNYLDVTKANILNKLNRYGEALQISLWLIENRSEGRWAKNFRRIAGYYKLEAESLLGLDRYAEALIAYDRAIYFNPDNPRNHGSKATVLRKMHRYEEAVIEYDEALKLDPENSLYLHYRDMVLDKLNNDTF